MPLFVPQICSMKSQLLQLIKKHKGKLTGAVLGSITGFLYYKLIGCSNGTCAISSNPYINTPYGALMGIFIAGIFSDNKKENNKN